MRWLIICFSFTNNQFISSQFGYWSISFCTDDSLLNEFFGLRVCVSPFFELRSCCLDMGCNKMITLSHHLASFGVMRFYEKITKRRTPSNPHLLITSDQSLILSQQTQTLVLCKMKMDFRPSRLTRQINEGEGLKRDYSINGNMRIFYSHIA